MESGWKRESWQKAFISQCVEAGRVTCRWCSPTMSVVSETILILGLLSLVVAAIIGNLLVCLSVILVRKLRKPQNYLLVSLALSDLFVALFVMPFGIVYELYEGVWPLSPSLCDLWVSGDVLLCSSSILNLCAISVDRYRAITRPLEYSSASSPRRMLTVIFFVWLSSACVSLPPVLLLGNEYMTPAMTPTCTISQNYWYQLYATMVSFYLPLCVMVVVYIKILRVVTVKKKQMAWTNSSSRHNSIDHNCTLTTNVNVTQSRQSQLLLQKMNLPLPVMKTQSGGQDQENVTTLLPSVPLTNRTERFVRPKVRLKDHKASTTLGIIMSAFIICWLPFFGLALLRPLFFQENEIPNWISSLFLWLGYANSALNPVIYATLNRDFRRPFQEILCCRCGTLDDLMRREFYDMHYGRDDQCERSKQKVKDAAQLGEHHPFHQSTDINGIEESDDVVVDVGWSTI